MEHIILLIQAIILGFQLYFTVKLFRLDQSRNRGYFVVSSNVTHLSTKKYYDLREPLFFSLKSDLPVFVTNSTLKVNGRTVLNGVPYKTGFDPGEDLGNLYLNLELKESELDGDIVDVVYILDLCNINNYKYVQEICVSFTKVPNIDYWTISRYNFTLK